MNDGRPDCGTSTQMRPRQIASLTGIRGISALWVLLFHVQNIGQVYGFSVGLPGYRLFEGGWSGVDLFFLLSGFMLMHTHAADFKKLKLSSITLFAQARFFRVYPISFIVLLLIVTIVTIDRRFAFQFASLAAGNLSAKSFVATALLATRWFPVDGDWNVPIWSLSAEILGYAAFPFLAFAIGRSRSRFLTMAFAVAAMANVFFLERSFGTFGTNDLTLRGALARMGGYFVAGVSLRQLAGLLNRSPSRLVVTTLGVLAFLGIALLSLAPLSRGFLPAAFGVLIFSLFFEQGPVNAVLASRTLMFLGRISFSLYLLHVMPLLAFNYHAQAWGLSILIYRLGLITLVACLFAVSWLLHVLVEQPVHRIGRRLGRKTNITIATGGDAAATTSPVRASVP